MLEFFANAIRHVIVKFFIFRHSNVLFIHRYFYQLKLTELLDLQTFYRIFFK